VIIDVNGYFAPPATGGLSLYPLTPCRVLDTRTASQFFQTGPFKGVHSSQIQGNCGVPSSATGYVFNATAVPTAALNFLAFWQQGASQTLPTAQ
jgi:hypothetical protein